VKTVCCWVDTLVAHSFCLFLDLLTLVQSFWGKCSLESSCLTWTTRPTKYFWVLRRCIVNRESDLLGLLGTSAVYSACVTQLLLSIHYLALRATVWLWYHKYQLVQERCDTKCKRHWVSALTTLPTKPSVIRNSYLQRVCHPWWTSAFRRKESPLWFALVVGKSLDPVPLNRVRWSSSSKQAWAPLSQWLGRSYFDWTCHQRFVTWCCADLLKHLCTGWPTYKGI